MYVYGLLTEPQEQSAEFTIYGSFVGRHKWVVVQINLRKVLGKYKHNISNQSCVFGFRICMHVMYNTTCMNLVQYMADVLFRLIHISAVQIYDIHIFILHLYLSRFYNEPTK